MTPFTLTDFVRESNRIEGIVREPTASEINAHKQFLALPNIFIVNLVDLVNVVQPDAAPRFTRGLDVRVGPHIPPPGGPEIERALSHVIHQINLDLSPFAGHLKYESLHPFTDGNGRSGRALWLWAMGGIDKAPLGFLHTFYYQALQGSR